MATFLRTLLVGACLVAATSDALAVVPRTAPLPGSVSLRSQTGQIRPATPNGEFQTLMAFGAGSIALLLLCRAYQHEGRAFAVGTIIFSATASLYGFLQGAWPLGFALAAYSIIAFRALLWSRTHVSLPRRPVQQAALNLPTLQPWEQSRLSRMFGPI